MFYNFPLKTFAMIHSIKDKREVTIIGREGENDYRAEYDGWLYTAIYNPFADCFYVDDIFGIVKKL